MPLPLSDGWFCIYGLYTIHELLRFHTPTVLNTKAVGGRASRVAAVLYVMPWEEADCPSTILSARVLIVL